MYSADKVFWNFASAYSKIEWKLVFSILFQLPKCVPSCIKLCCLSDIKSLPSTMITILSRLHFVSSLDDQANSLYFIFWSLFAI